MNGKKARSFRKLAKFDSEKSVILQDQEGILTNPLKNVVKRIKKVVTNKPDISREDATEYIMENLNIDLQTKTKEEVEEGEAVRDSKSE